MGRKILVILTLAILSACGDQERRNAEKVNNEKFRYHKEREAHFVIDVLDTSYGLIDLAKIGESRIRDPKQKAQVQMIIQAHTSAMVRLKAYAEKRGITIPLTGPRKSKTNVERLRRKGEREFSHAWITEMKELQHKLKIEIEGYQRKAVDTALIHVLDSTLRMVKTNNEIITRFESGKNHESI